MPGWPGIFSYSVQNLENLNACGCRQKAFRIVVPRQSLNRSGQLPVFIPPNIGISDFLDKFRFKFHRANTVDFAVDIMVAVDQADVFDFGADFDNQ